MNAVQPDLVSLLFDSQPDTVTWLVPVFDSTGQIADFTVGYCNAAACATLRSTKDVIMSQSLLTTNLMDETSKKGIFDQCSQVWKTNQNIEFSYFSPALQKHFHVQRSKINGGVLNITRDHTQLETIRQEKEKQSELLHQLIACSPYGISLYQSIRDVKNNIIDFKLLLCNEKCSEITGFSVEELYKYTVKELMLIRGHSNYFDMCAKVVSTGKPLYMEYFSKARNQWMAFSIVKFNDGYLLNYIDISDLKNMEKKASQQTAMLEGILNATVGGLFAMEPITGFSGKILDFKFIMLNKSAERLLKLKPEDKSKSYLTLFPTAKTNGLFEWHCEVLQTGKPITRELHYTGEIYNQKYLVSISKMGENGVVQNFIELNS